MSEVSSACVCLCMRAFVVSALCSRRLRVIICAAVAAEIRSFAMLFLRLSWKIVIPHNAGPLPNVCKTKYSWPQIELGNTTAGGSSPLLSDLGESWFRLVLLLLLMSQQVNPDGFFCECVFLFGLKSQPDLKSGNLRDSRWFMDRIPTLLTRPTTIRKRCPFFCCCFQLWKSK